MDKGWSINGDDWEALERTLPSTETWNLALLTTNDQALVPEGPGVYAICAPPPTANRQDRSTLFDRLATPLYIGRSESNIKSRFLAHCRTTDAELRRAKQCYHRVQLNFWFMELPVNTVRDVEAWLIKCFGPPVNRRAGTITGTIKPPLEA